jgi:small conductance mechanosensitive channel
MFEQENLIQLFNQYVVPWSIKILLAFLIFYIGQLIVKLLSSALGKMLSHTKLDTILIDFIKSLTRALLMVVVIIAALDQLGVNTNSVIAILGGASLAVGLALQGSLQHFAAGFILLIFRPFKSGDYVEVAGVAGSIDKIGIFSTTLNTIDNKQVIVPNGTIYSSNIINYSALGTRRIDMIFGIGYGDDMRKARDVINTILAQDERVLKDPKPVVAVGELGASRVNFYVRPWVLTANYLTVQFDLIEKIKQAFDDNGITIPFPQMDIHWNKPAE